MHNSQIKNQPVSILFLFLFAVNIIHLVEKVSETKVFLEQDLSARQREMEEYTRNMAELRCLLGMEKEGRQGDKLEYERKERSAKAQLDSITIQLEVKEKEYERVRVRIILITL